MKKSGSLLIVSVVILIVSCAGPQGRRLASIDEEVRYKVGSELAPKKHGRSTWSTGFVIGKKSQSSKKLSIILSRTKEGIVQMGAFDDPKAKNFPPQSLSVSFHSSRIYKKFKKLDGEKTYVFRYRHIHILSPFHLTRSKYIVMSIEPFSDFNQSESYEKFGEAFEDFFQAEGWQSADETRSGRIVHVSRWGFLGTACTVYLHEKGFKEVKEYHTSYVDGIGKTLVKKALSDKMDYSTSPSMTYHTVKQVANINSMNVYTEDGCRFAEDVALSGRNVDLRTSTQFVEIWAAHPIIIHSMSLSK